MIVAVLFFVLSLYLIITKVIFQRCRNISGSEWLIKLIRNGRRNVSEKAALGGENVRALVVTAHPDDECMFFAPAILRLLELDVSVHLMCLSSGNYYNQGNQRRKELLDSCDVLGIPASQVVIVDQKDSQKHTLEVCLESITRELPDDPAAEWSVHLISSLILKRVRDSAIDLVLTFDEGGVSGHANHIAIYRALRYLSSTGRIPNYCCLLTLQTVAVIRKYLALLELPVSWLRPSDLCSVIGFKEYRQAKRAMCCHRSQMLWFRHLYVLASRYMFINTFQVIAHEKEDLKIY